MHETEEKMNKLVYFFCEGHSDGDPSRKDILGGKGASLAAMSRAGLPVPPGFTISVECCPLFLETGRWAEGLEEQVKENLQRLEEVTGRKFGEGPQPLLVSVRSGAARSMPGMMDTILNCGLHPGLAEVLPDKENFWVVYAQFVKMFAKTVGDIPEDAFEKAAEGISDPRKTAEAYRALYEEKTGRRFPMTPWEELVECINAVFRSWNSERAVVYRKHNRITDLKGTAVTVQAMFPSQKSGIGFTANPAAPDAEEIIIEASYGLGESIVSGDVTPDRFVIDRNTLQIKEKSIGTKNYIVRAMGDAEEYDPNAQSITDEQALELGRIALKIEEYFGFPVDFEWGWADGRFGLLQSRPIRGLEVARDIEKGRQEEIERLKRAAGGSRRVWVIHNLAETLQSPTPMTWDIIREFMSGKGGFGRMYLDFGYMPSKRVMEEGFLELICGRIYADPERTAELFWDGMPLVYDIEKVAKDPNLLEAAPDTFAPEKSDERFLLRLPKLLYGMLRASRRMKKARANAVAEFEKSLKPYLAYVEAKRNQQLSSLTLEELLSELAERNQRIMTEFGGESLKPGFFGGLARAALEESLVQVMGEEEGTRLCAVLTSGLEGDTTFEQNLLLYQVAQGEKPIEEFLDKYGHRAVGEMELMNPRWREDPSYLYQIIETYKQPGMTSPEEMHERNRERRLEAERNLGDVLARWGASSQLEDFMDLIREAQTLLPYRETGKHYLMMGYELIRNVLCEIGRRLEIGDDVFFLQRAELERFADEKESLMETIERRKIRWQSAQRLECSRVIDTDNIEKLGLPEEIVSAGEYKADALAAGSLTGTARIVFDPKEASDLPEDCILVCPSTDPGWTALFARIRGLIVERGGALSHGAITARDFGIPAVALPDATRKIKDGSRIRIDGNTGKVSILEE